MNNDIIDLLNLKGDNLKILDIECIGDTKIVTMEKELEEHMCPRCGYIMHSRGVKVRTIKHPILRDGYKFIIKLRQRRWLCTNQNCKYNISDQFSFVNKSRRTTNITELLVVESFKDLNKTAAEIAREHNISDHLAIDIFNKHVQMKRLPLPEIISIDEVYLDMDSRCKYVLVIQDFITGDPIDLVKSRQKIITDDYFKKIPLAERNNVKYLISDMYQPYINYTNKYFPNAIAIVDSFHVMQWIIHKIDGFCRQLLREFKNRDETKARELAIKQGKDTNDLDVPISNEVYLLQKHRWVILQNTENIEYDLPVKYNLHFKRYMSTYAIEEEYLNIHPDFFLIRELKEEYVQFNHSRFDNYQTTERALNAIIDIYEDCPIKMFNEFAETLKRYREPILNSFTYVEKTTLKGPVSTRLSNGPIEGLNRKAKDMKRNGRGYINFDNLRNRFLFATRKNPVIKN